MTKGISELRPERLEQALSVRGLTKGQLAALVGVSASTVTKWSKGDQFPEAETFERLASVLNVRSEWLTRPPLKPVTAPLFRSNASALKSGREKLQARITLLQEAALLFAEYVEYPALNLPVRLFSSANQITRADIEAAADECRELWKIGKGPIQDLLLAAEGAGVIVVREETEIPVIEGLSCWSDELGGRPLIHLSADKANAFRSRFDLAHEIGHLVLHRNFPPPPDREAYNLMETQAHQFAGALLLPAETFADEVRQPVNLDSLLALKQRWGASVAAMLMRLHALRILNDEQKLVLFKRRSARWGSKSEPGDQGWAPEKPRLLRRSIELLVSEGVLPAERIPDYVGTSEMDVEQLCHLRPRYFEAPGQVMELALLRSPKPQEVKNAAEPEFGGSVVDIRRFRR
jgi:Zn-dependent peptidase ImmA (M78 family)/DNA-binding XRE family transcriptional regulator